MEDKFKHTSLQADEIKENIARPEVLERLYRKNKTSFKQAFQEIWPEIQHSEVARVWSVRLNADQTPLIPTGLWDWAQVFGLILLAGLLVKIPDFFGWQQEEFMQRNMAFFIFPSMLTMFFLQNKSNINLYLVILGVYGLLATYINVFYTHFNEDVYILVCLHIPLISWALTGHYKSDMTVLSVGKWVDFLRQNADIIIMSGLFLLSGFLVTAITVGLFEVIGWNLEIFLTHYWLVWGLPAIPILAVFFVQHNPDLVHKISPLIARVFTPIVLFLLTGFVVSSLFSGQNPYEDRDFLILFNVVLLGVMALIFFSLTDENTNQLRGMSLWVIIGLALLTILVNGIAFSAIIFRISSWGFTPNRVAVLGSNLLMLTHLVWITISMIRMIIGKKTMEEVHGAIVYFLPMYFIWACIVVIGFPLIFTIT